MPGVICARPPYSLLGHVTPPISRHVWSYARVLLVGAIQPRHPHGRLHLRNVGLAHTRHLQRDHRVLTRATWSSRRAG